jgi:aminoglycoside 6-adenylyltransferase
MNKLRNKKEVLNEVVKFAKNNSNIEGVLLTVSMANPNRKTDLLSDLDIVFITREFKELVNNKSWRKEFGTILSFFNDQFSLEGIKSYTCLVLYDDYIRIDFSIWSVDLIKKIIKKDKLPDYLDSGYEVLLDKNNILHELKEPSYQAFKIDKPTEKEFLKNVNDFWWDITYIAKYF